MKLKMFRLFIIAVGFTLQTQAETRCELQRYAELPVTMIGTSPIVQGTINGQKARFLADSGAFFSFLGKESATRFNLKLEDAPPYFWVNGVGGSEKPKLTKAKQFTLDGFVGGHVFKDVNFLVMDGVAGGDVDGIIGENALGGADTEYDLGAGFIRLFESKGCSKHSMAYWNKDNEVAVVDIEERTPAQPHLIGTAILNGKKIHVMFDSGAARSILTLHAAARAGIKPEDDSVKDAGISGGIGKKLLDTWISHFDTLDIGGELIKNAKLRIGDIDLSGKADMLLGADFFLSHRIYADAHQHKLYFTYNGGPVFDLGTRSSNTEARSTATSNSSSTSSLSSSSSSSLSARDVRLRGVASAGREQFQQAIADLDLAVKLDSNDTENFYQRGLAHWGNHEPELALADFNHTLALQPNQIAALISRGTLQLEKKNDKESQADFAAALKLASHDGALVLQIAGIYGEHKQYDEEIRNLNIWVDANPKNERLQSVLDQRCHARLMANKESELALADCNAAKKIGSAYSSIYTNRGLVYLRLGQLDESMKDLRKALKLQPKDAHTLYGLALVEHQKGFLADGDRDAQAAIAIDPNIEKVFDEMGMKLK